MNSELVSKGFKTTELGPLPEEWEVVRLGEVAEYINGYAFKPIQWKKRGLPIIRIQNLTRSTDEINYYDEELEERYKIRNGDLLISWSASLGVFKWSGSDAWLNQHIFKVDNYSPNIWKDYLHYVVMTKIESMKSKTHGSTMHHITKKEFLAVKIPLPPLPEQRAIATVLSTVQAAKEKTEAVISATKELKKSLMKHLFTYGPVSLEEAENVPLKETEIGMVPEEAWDVVMLGDKGHFQYGYTTSATDEDTGTKFLRITDINEGGFVNWGAVPYGSIDDKNIQKFRLSEGDILFARIGATTGKTCIIEGATPHAIFASYLIRFVSNEELYSKYVFYFTQTRGYQELVNAGKEGKLKKGLSATELKNFKILLPPLPIQQKIASILSAVDEKIEKEENKKKSLEELFKSLLNILMTGKLRVNHLEV